MENEKGVTLIELLAAISILLIISSILWGVLTGANKNYMNISGKGNLEQESNLILNTIKNYHQKQSLHDNVNSDSIGTYILKYDSATQKGFIGKNSSTLIPLQSDNIKVIIKIDDTIPADSNPITIFPSNPLYIDIKVMNQQGQSYEVDTIIKQY